MYDKAQDMTHAVITCGCERRDSRMLFQAVWKPVVEYVLPQAFLTPSQLDTIQTRNFPALYAKCGYNRKSPREVLWGPTDLSGAGFIPLYATASSGVILHFLRNWRTPTEKIGQVLRALYSWSQMNAGTTFSLVEQPQRQVLHLRGTVIPYI